MCIHYISHVEIIERDTMALVTAVDSAGAGAGACAGAVLHQHGEDNSNKSTRKERR